MRPSTLLSLIAGSAHIASAAPKPATTGLRLIKTFPTDPGTWVTEDQKDTDFTAKGIRFIDVTDITDAQTLRILSTDPDAVSSQRVAAAAAVTYPTTITHQSAVNPLVSQVSTTSPQTWLRTLTNFQTRHYRSTYGVEASTWLFNTVKSIAAANPAIVVTQFTHSSFSQKSVIARIPGTSANLVVVGAHLDSTGGSTTARGPGAEDDGSGCVVILEALRVLANARFAPKDTLEFHFYAGEEGGLLGSADIFKNYKAAGKTVLAMLNQDMAGYSPGGKLTMYTDYVDSSLTTYVTRIATAYIGATSTSSCGYGCSDHASARSAGFPAAYVGDEPFNSSADFIHSSQDTYDKIQWPTILRHAKFITAFLVEASFL
ncbi:putative peptidase family M28 [Podospora conica]|nr:putative peptidase family M28 [Schizothecium conicum]